MLTDAELIKYKRQLIIKGWGKETQDKLKRARVFVAGTGGLGSPVLFYLAVAGVGTLTLCDYDRIDPSNLNRQILHTEKRTGTPKVDSAFHTLNEANSSVNVIPMREKITRKNAEKIIGDPDLVIDCLDNFETRHILNEVCVRKPLPMIHAGVSEFHGQITFLQPPETPCLACFLSDIPPRRTIPIMGATAGVIGALQAVEAVKFLTGLGSTLKNRLLFWDGLAMRFETVTISKNPKCKVCGGKKT